MAEKERADAAALAQETDAAVANATSVPSTPAVDEDAADTDAVQTATSTINDTADDAETQLPPVATENDTVVSEVEVSANAQPQLPVQSTLSTESKAIASDNDDRDDDKDDEEVKDAVNSQQRPATGVITSDNLTDTQQTKVDSINKQGKDTLVTTFMPHQSLTFVCP